MGTSSRISYLVLVSFLSLSLAGKSIQYSGISFTSQDIDIKDAFPNSVKLVESLGDTLINHLNDNSILNANLRIEVSDSFSTTPYSIIVAIDHESIDTQYVDHRKSCTNRFRLGMQVIVFSTRDQQVLSISPLTLRSQYQDPSINGICGLDKKIELLRFAELSYGIQIPIKNYKNYISLKNTEMIKLIRNKSIEFNLFSKKDKIFGMVINKILSTKPENIQNSQFFVGIDDIKLGKLALEQMLGNKEFKKNSLFADSYGDFKKESYKVWAGQQFSKWFSDTFEFPLIPYVKGKALGKDITLKFENGNEALNLRLPSLDYGFVINIKGFKKVKLDESNLREAFAWAAFSSIEFHNVGIEKLSEISLKHVYTREINKSDSVEDWDNFNYSQNRIMKDYVTNLETLDRKWLKKASNFSSKEFKKHSNIIKKNIRL